MKHQIWLGCSAFVHVQRVFMGYPFPTNGYMVWIPEERKCRTSRNVVFNENETYKDTLNKRVEHGESVAQEEIQKKKKPKKRVLFSDDLIQGPTITTNELERSVTSDHGNDMEESSSSENSESKTCPTEEADQHANDDTPQSLDNYVLARDRERMRNMRPPSRYEDGNFVAYALTTAEDLEIDEPRSYA